MIQLQNRTKTIQCFNLPHKEPYLQRIERRFEEQLPDGTVGVREVVKHLPKSFTILAGETVEMPDDVQHAREVKAALDRGALRLVQLANQDSNPPTPAPLEVRPKNQNQQRRRSPL